MKRSKVNCPYCDEEIDNSYMYDLDMGEDRIILCEECGDDFEVTNTVDGFEICKLVQF